MPTFILLDAVGIVSIIIGAVALVVLLVFGGIFFYKRSFCSTSKNLRKTYDTYHAQLTSDCKNMVNRLKVLGEHNDYFNTMYQDRQKQYDDILNKRDKDVFEELNSLDVLVKEKKYKDYKEVEADCTKAVDDFEKAVCVFNSDLNSILQDDNDIHSNAVTVKGKYRSIHEFYNEHQTELKPLEKSFDKIFRSSEKSFNDFDLNANQANFSQAKKILDKLDKLYDAILAVLDKLPSLEMSISAVLPEKCEKLNEEYQKMIQDGFIVSQMNVEDKLSSFKAEIAQMQALLLRLDIRGVDEKIQDIQSRITDIFANFQEERNAKEIYFSKQNSLADSSFSVEKRYARMINSLPKYQKAFVLDDKYVSQIKALKTDIETIGILKRELDSYLDTSARQPYLVITKKMTDMDSEMNKAIRVMDDYSAYLNSLNEESTEVFEGLRNAFVSLKKAQNIVHSINVPSYTNSLKPTFESSFAEIKKINQIVVTTPIDVPLAKEKFESFKNSVDGFTAAINTKKEEADKAEMSIVYANLYRIEYTDSRGQLDQAEQSFYEGDFSRASSIALNVIQTFEPPSQKD